MATALAVAPSTSAQAAVLTGTLTVTTPANAKLAADTAKQVIVLTVSGTGAPKLSEDNVASVTFHATDTTCQGLLNYVVTSATSLTIKTPTGGCDVSSAAESVVITFANGDTLTKASALTFVTAPKVAYTASSVRPVVTENSADQAFANQSGRFMTTGGQVGRVKAASDFAFDPRTASGLKVAVGGKDATDVKVYAATTGNLMASATTTAGMVEGATPTEAGNYLTFKTATGMDASTDSVSITQNGVSKSFVATDYGSTFDVVTGPQVTAVSPNSGKIGGGATVTVTASGLTKTWVAGTDYDVYFCGKVATGETMNTAGTSISVVTPTTIGNDAAGVGTGNYAGSCAVTIKTPSTNPTYTSPVTAAAVYTFLNE